jgi:hypothetical protein
LVPGDGVRLGKSAAVLRVGDWQASQNSECAAGLSAKHAAGKRRKNFSWVSVMVRVRCHGA